MTPYEARNPKQLPPSERPSHAKSRCLFPSPATLLVRARQLVVPIPSPQWWVWGGTSLGQSLRREDDATVAGSRAGKSCTAPQSRVELRAWGEQTVGADAEVQHFQHLPGAGRHVSPLRPSVTPRSRARHTFWSTMAPKIPGRNCTPIAPDASIFLPLPSTCPPCQPDPAFPNPSEPYIHIMAHRSGASISVMCMCAWPAGTRRNVLEGWEIVGPVPVRCPQMATAPWTREEGGNKNDQSDRGFLRRHCSSDDE